MGSRSSRKDVGECGKEGTLPLTWIVALQAAEAARFFPKLPFRSGKWSWDARKEPWMC